MPGDQRPRDAAHLPTKPEVISPWMNDVKVKTKEKKQAQRERRRKGVPEGARGDGFLHCWPGGMHAIILVSGMHFPANTFGAPDWMLHVAVD